ncbi:MAG: hypothetical protein AAB263_06795, partial [Planctomycetota bacterium]
MRLTRVASAALIAIVAVAAEPGAGTGGPNAPVVPRNYTAQAISTVSSGNVGDAKLLAKVSLFVTEDGGRTWHKASDTAVPENAATVPTITFNAAKDGTFGLWTSVTARNGTAEAEPTAGSLAKRELIVDRVAPALERLEATLGGTTDGQTNLALSWKVNDPNLGDKSVTIEVSTDQGKSFTARHSGSAEGTTALAIAAGGAGEIQVRAIARDLAGNVLTTPAKVVALPSAAKSGDPEAMLAAAVAQLPKPDELGVSARGGSPIVAAGAENPVAGVGSVKADLPAAPVQKVPESEVVSGRDVEGRFARAANKTDNGKGEDPQPAQPTTPRATTPDAALPFLVGSSADDALGKAAKTEQSGDFEGALAQYLRLHRSSVAKDAIANELALLNSVGDDKT